MKVLYLTSETEDYLQDQILIGLRRIEEVDVIDVPRKGLLYEDCEVPDEEIHGNGFTTWKILPNKEGIDRENIENRLRSREFDLVIFGSIQRQVDKFYEFKEKNLFSTEAEFVFLDGEDEIKLKGFWRKNKARIKRAFKLLRSDKLELNYKNIERQRTPIGSLPNLRPVFEPALEEGTYFKRELNNEVIETYSENTILPISFYIPEEKISDFETEKEQTFQTHVVNEEALKLDKVQENSSKGKVFDEEEKYYEDISKSYFGITEKRAGWDAMRHYEIAANGAVIAFHKLREKPHNSPPTRLQDMENCITYRDATELKKKAEFLKERESKYRSIREKSQRWIKTKSCKKGAENLLQQVKNS